MELQWLRTVSPLALAADLENALDHTATPANAFMQIELANRKRHLNGSIMRHKISSQSEQLKTLAASLHGRRRWLKNNHFSAELKGTAALAWPMVLTQVVQLIMMTTDLALIGRLGAQSLAAAALASRVYLVGFTIGATLLAAISPLASEAFAANNLRIVRRSLRMGLWAAPLLSLPIIALALSGEHILLLFGQEQVTARLAWRYLLGLTWGAIPALWFQAIRSFMGAVNRPQPILWIMLIAIPINASLAYLLIYGRLGAPRLELFGAGIATTLVNCCTCVASLYFAKMLRPFRDYHVLAYFWRFDWPAMRELIVIGTPLSIASLSRYGLSLALALFAGLISTQALAAHQIAAQVTATLFMISFGISMAAAVRVGRAVGRKDAPGIRRASLAAVLVGISISALLTLAVIVGRFRIAELFLDASAVESHATIELAAQLLLVCTSFFITDATQSIAAGALRGLKDTQAPVLLGCIAYWLIGLSTSYLLGFEAGLGPVGIWIGLSIGTAVYAALLLLRLQVLLKRLLLESEVLTGSDSDAHPREGPPIAGR